MSVAEAPTLRTVEVRHTIDAPLEMVFDAWITPELIEAWWGPEGFTTVVRKLDPRPGGRFVFEMTASDGTASSTAGFYREIMRPHRLVLEFTDHCNANLPEGFEPQLAPSLVTVEFQTSGGQAEVIVTHAELRPTYAELATFGWSGAMRKLVAAVTRSSADGR